MHRLVVQNGLAKGHALAGVSNGLLDAIGERLNGVGRSPQALLLKLLHLVGETQTFFANAVALGHAHIVKVDQTGVARHHADLADFFGYRDARRVHGHDDQAFVFVRRAF